MRGCFSYCRKKRKNCIVFIVVFSFNYFTECEEKNKKQNHACVIVVSVGEGVALVILL